MFGRIVVVLMIMCTVAACVLAPMQGDWTPDVAVGFCAVIATMFYGVYRMMKSKLKKEG